MDRIFKIHPSQCSKIMGRMGLTEAQEKTYQELVAKESRTEKQQATLDDLKNKRENPELPEGAKTFLEEWYAGDTDPVYSVEMAKGNIVEGDTIDFMAQVLGFGVAEKNERFVSNDFIEGTCDVHIPEKRIVVDTKSPWSNKSFLKNVHEFNDSYEFQGICYCDLYDADTFILFYGLMDTPPELTYEREVIYSDRPDEERWIAYQTCAKPDVVLEIYERVKLCRKYLKEYDTKVKSMRGKITIVNSSPRYERLKTENKVAKIAKTEKAVNTIKRIKELQSKLK